MPERKAFLLRIDPKLWEDLEIWAADELRSIIANGKHHMPKFEGKLQPSEIDALVEQIRSQSKQK